MDSIKDDLQREGLQQEEEIIEEYQLEGQQPPQLMPQIDLGFLKAPTGEGSVEEYIDKPLNFNGKTSTARVLRGLQGIANYFGQTLDLAIIDIVVGLAEMRKER